MPATHPSLGTENQSPYQVESKREIFSILKGFRDKSQLISMLINGGSEAFITSVLDIDDKNNTLIIDSTPSNEANQRIIAASTVFFDGLLDRISIQFTSSNVKIISYEGKPALQMPMPTSVIRLQRRENYRINTPITTPIKCVIPVELESGIFRHKFSLVDISCGGIAILDDGHLIDIAIGTGYPHCQMDIPGIGIIEMELQIRNSQELTLLNGKTTRRIGCAFLNLSSKNLAAVQRYIMKLERERNAKITGIN